MTDTGSRSWEEALDALRRAAGELRAAAGSSLPGGPVDDERARRLKADIGRLEGSARDLVGKFTDDLGARRAEIESSIDRERAERSAAQIQTSLEDLAAMATDLASQVVAAAGSSLKQAEPELKAAVREIENVAGSAANWVRSTIDAPERGAGGQARSGQPPLDDL
jgi:hypothetical protein